MLPYRVELKSQNDSSTCIGGTPGALQTLTLNRLGVSTHVAELQLIHVSFARLKASSGHDTYKIYRDLRGS